MSEKSHELKFSKELAINTTPIPGLLILDLPVHGDNRGWFKENWQRQKMVGVGLPDFGPIQNNISYNSKKGVTRGIHAEPWDKFISIGSGKVFGAWVDLRAGDSFGSVFTAELDPSKAIFVPRGVGNSYQSLEDNTVYSYLVNEHWSADAQSNYISINLDDEIANIKWPIPLRQAEISKKDQNNPKLSEIIPLKPRKTLIIGAYGQLGRALQVEFPDAEYVDRDTFDMSDPSIIVGRNWREYQTIINAGAYTAVDLAETPAGRRDAWLSNSTALSYLAQITATNNLTLVHVSTDYVFDGTKPNHSEDEVFSPINVYGQTKAAGDLVVSTLPKHYIIRTSWVIGDGKNFVLIMKSLAEKGIKPTVVNDQIGRLTFTSDLARAIKHLLTPVSHSPTPIPHPYGTYNVTNDGKPVSWADVAGEVYKLSGHNPDDVTDVSTDEYYADKTGIAPRPLQSTLNLDKIKATGFTPRNWREALTDYLKN